MGTEKQQITKKILAKNPAKDKKSKCR